MNNIDTIIFDAGGVLFYINEFRNDITRRILSSMNYTKELIELALSKANNFDNEKYDRINNWSDEKKWLLERTKIIVSVIDPQNEVLLDKLFILNCDTFQYKLFDDTISVLEKLKDKFTLHVLSNANASLDWAFDYLDLRKYFKHIIISSYVGFDKPDNRIYTYTIEKIQKNAASCIFIDDKIENIIAAKEVGLNVFHMDRKMGLSLKDFIINCKYKI